MAHVRRKRCVGVFPGLPFDLCFTDRKLWRTFCSPSACLVPGPTFSTSVKTYRIHRRAPHSSGVCWPGHRTQGPKGPAGNVCLGAGDVGRVVKRSHWRRMGAPDMWREHERFYDTSPGRALSKTFVASTARVNRSRRDCSDSRPMLFGC